MFKHILISTDGSAVSNRAAKAGVALVKVLSARITAYFSAAVSMERNTGSIRATDETNNF